MTETEEYEIIRCPFCGYQGIEAKPGKSVCPECDAAFELDDRVECVFVDPDNPRLPIEGIVCTRCGLV
jgi:DNA-directed RNA polymerase subunit RPC12/RpoP